MTFFDFANVHPWFAIVFAALALVGLVHVAHAIRKTIVGVARVRAVAANEVRRVADHVIEASETIEPTETP